MSAYYHLFPAFGAPRNVPRFMQSAVNSNGVQLRDFTLYEEVPIAVHPLEFNATGGLNGNWPAADCTGYTLNVFAYTKAVNSDQVTLAETATLTWDADDEVFYGTLNFDTAHAIAAAGSLAAKGSVPVMLAVARTPAGGKPQIVQQEARLFYAPDPGDLSDPEDVDETHFANLLQAALEDTNSIAWPRVANTFSPYVRRPALSGIYEGEDGLFVRPFFDGPGLLPALSVEITDPGPDTDSQAVTVLGTAGKRYAARILVELMTELHPATGGTSKLGDSAYFRRGTPTPANNSNLCTLTVSSPAAVYQLNYGASAVINTASFLADLIVDSGATVTLLLDKRDGLMSGVLQTVNVTLDQAAELGDSLEKGVLVVNCGESVNTRKLVWQDVLDAVGGGPQLWYRTAPLAGRIGPRIGITLEDGGVVDLLSDIAWGVHLEDDEGDPKTDFVHPISGYSLLESGPTWVNLPGKLGTAYRIADVNAGKLWRAHADVFAIGPAFTYAGWFKNDQNTGDAEGPLVSKASEYLLNQTGTQLQLTVYLAGGAAGAVISVPQPERAEWFFVAWQVDGTTCRMSVNGGAWIEAAQASVNPTGADFALSDGTTVMGGDTHWDEQAIWKRALTLAEVRALYNDGEGVAYPYDGVDGTTPVHVRIEAGDVTGFSALVAGEPVYLDPDTPGGLTQTRPAEGKPVRLVGFARAADTIYFEPRRETDEVATNIVKAAATTTDNTPTDLAAIYGSLVLENNSARAFSLLVKSERLLTHGSVDMWQFTGIIKRDANAASTAVTLIPGPYTGTTACVVAVAEDAAAGALKITVTNPNAQTWRSTALLTWL